MKLTFVSKHLSIENFNEMDTADFMVLTGVNGSGKSHLLDAIEQNKVRIDSNDPQRIVKFNFETFRLENEGTYNAQQIYSERDAAWGFFESQIKPHISSYRSNIGDGYASAVEQCRTEKKPFWKADIPLDPYRKNIRDLFRSPNIKGNQAAIGVYSLALKLPYSIDEIDRDEFTSRYKPFAAKQDFLPMALGRVIWDYYAKYRNNQLNEFQNIKYGKKYPALSEEEFLDVHGEKPWDIINDILKTFNSLEYRVNSPEGEDIFSNFTLRLVHTGKENLEIDFNSLSSGERVLMALVASIYKSSSDNYFPDVLLLDELDASLHPSMMKNMLAVIKDVFLARGVKVILVTHSPTTIALCPEESIYVMNKSGAQRIEKKSCNEALAILTEGFATLAEGLVLFDEVAKNKVSIFTEGKNTLFLRQVLKHSGLNAQVSLVEGVEAISGKNQLRTLFDFFSRVPHSSKVLFIWDCDVNFSLVEKNSTYPFVFTRNTANKFTSAGIENLFPEHLFDGFLKTITLSKGDAIVEFDESRKRDFEAHVFQNASDADFRNFEPLLEKIRSLLNDGAAEFTAPALGVQETA